MIITDLDHGQVLVYTRTGLLTKRITGLNMPVDVAMGYQCDYLIVADFGHDCIYLL